MRRTVALALTIFIASLAARAQQQSQQGQQPQQQPQGQQQRPQTPPTPPPAPGTPTKPLVPVAASTLAAKPDAYVGEFVSLGGAVEQRMGDRVFSVDQDKTKPTGKEVVVIMRNVSGAVEPNTYVTVVGEVVKLDPAELKERNFTGEVPGDIMTKYANRPIVLASAVITPAGINVAMRLPPPMTRDEADYQKVMKQVGSANAALRKAIEGSDVKLARENAAALKQAFSQAESFWNRKDKDDAKGWSQDARRIAETIDRSAAAGKWDEVKTHAGSLGKTCQACHAAYRERFDDGSFRIKLP
jgi:soluble cytochrome b562